MDNLAYNNESMGPSPKNIELASRFRDMVDTLPDPFMQESPEKITPIDISEYISFMRDFLHLDDITPANLAEAIMPESILTKKLSEIDQDSHLKTDFMEGYIYQIVPIPCTSFGTLYNEDEIINGNHIRRLTREDDPKGMTIEGFSPMKTFVHKLLPTKFEDCKFKVGKYDHAEPYEISEDDRKRIKAYYKEAFHKAKTILKDALEDEK